MRVLGSRKKPVSRKAARPKGGVSHKGGLWESVRDWSSGALVALFFVVLVVFGLRTWQWLMAPTTLPIRHVIITGQLAHLNKTKLRRIVDQNLRAGFFGVNLHAISQALDALPWVANARVRRIWPDALQIRIEEQRPVATWDGVALLNASGQVFKPSRDTFPKHLPALSGPAGKEDELVRRYFAVRKLFGSAGLEVRSLHENARRAFSLELSNGIEVIIGRDWSLARMKKMLAVYRRLLSQKTSAIARIDLRYPNGFSVAWKKAYATSNKTAGGQ